MSAPKEHGSRFRTAEPFTRWKMGGDTLRISRSRTLHAVAWRLKMAGGVPRAERRSLRTFTGLEKRLVVPWQGLALIVLPALLLMGIESYSVTRTGPQIQANQALGTHTLGVTNEARALDNAVRDAESGQRGFLIAGNNAYLAAYAEGVSETKRRLGTLQMLTGDNPRQQKRIGLLQTETASKFDELHRTVDLRRNSGFEAARRIVGSRASVGLMGVIKGGVGSLIKDETILLRQHQQAFARANEKARIVSLAALALALLATIGGTVLLMSFSARQLRSSEDLRESEERFRLLVSGVKD